MAKGIKTGGRDKGTPNAITKEIREILKTVIETELQNISEKMAKLTDRERLEIVIKLLPYVLPRLEPEQQFNEPETEPTIIYIKFPENYTPLPSCESQVDATRDKTTNKQ